MAAKVYPRAIFPSPPPPQSVPNPAKPATMRRQRRDAAATRDLLEAAPARERKGAAARERKSAAAREGKGAASAGERKAEVRTLEENGPAEEGCSTGGRSCPRSIRVILHRRREAHPHSHRRSRLQMRRHAGAEGCDDGWKAEGLAQ
ncbi:hypothetical protein SETIT_1G172600v2 [Setaria italica]|uniref:Uncharacterized protein n=1 Tax=Setaria italica TaxID=4555 RepID=A0A368PLM3_SETIT|nr:hypothetical protein SETIT_1G172600v2 [Setaria italica]